MRKEKRSRGATASPHCSTSCGTTCSSRATPTFGAYQRSKAGLITAAATLAVGLLTLNQALVGVFYDDGLYAGLATALASGHGYVHPNLPGMPGAVHYPPLYPVLLTPFFGVLSVKSAAIAGKVLNALLNAGAAGLIAWHATKTELLGPPPAVPRWVPSVLVFAAAIAIPVLATQGVLFAEPLFS